MSDDPRETRMGHWKRKRKRVWRSPAAIAGILIVALLLAVGLGLYWNAEPTRSTVVPDPYELGLRSVPRTRACVA